MHENTRTKTEPRFQLCERVEARRSATTTTDPKTSVGRTPVHAVWLQPDDLYRGDAFHTFQPSSCNHHTPIDTTWDGFCEFLSHSTEGASYLWDRDVAKRARGALIPGRYSVSVGRKDLAPYFLGSAMLVIDIDCGDPQNVAEALCMYRCVIHSTYKHTPLSPRCRAFLLLDREIRRVWEYNALERAVADYLCALGFNAPAADSTMGKIAFLPMHQRGVSPVFVTAKGHPFPVERTLKQVQERERLERAEREARRQKYSGRGSNATWAIRYATERVAAAPNGERHNTRRDQARWLSELGVDEEVIRQACLDPSADAKAVATVEWAISKGREAHRDSP